MRSYDQRNVDIEWRNATPVEQARSVSLLGACQIGLREERS